MVKITNKKVHKRQTLLQENEFLKRSLKALQTEHGLFVSKHHQLEIEDSVLKEKLSNFGVRDLFKNIGFFGMGIAFDCYIGRNYGIAALVAMISCTLLMFFSVYDSFRKIQVEKKEKV